jgi:cystathionine gamma-synthase
VSLPQWSDVVGYEEGDVSVTSKMICGYPRFVYHPYVIRLMHTALAIDAEGQVVTTGSGEGSNTGDLDCIVLPSRDAAFRARDFLIKATLINHDEQKGSSLRLTSPDNALEYNTSVEGEGDEQDFFTGMIRVLDLHTTSSNVHALLFPAETKYAMAAKAFWQHAGEVVSSRRAETALIELGAFGSSSLSSSDSDPEKHVSQPIRFTHSLLVNDNDCSSSTTPEGHTGGVKEITITCPTSNQNYACKYPIRKSMCDNLKRNQDIDDPKAKLRADLAKITHTSHDMVHLAPSGMGAIYHALRASRRQRLMNSNSSGEKYEDGGTSIVFGFPYLDTLKQCGRPELCPGGVEFFGNGDEVDLENLKRMLEQRRSHRRQTLKEPDADAGICALITEFPSNPLLNCHDLMALRDLATEYNFALVVDDTIGNFANVDLIGTGIADLVCTSLTKIYSGRGDVMGGSLICNPHTPMGQAIGAELYQIRQNHKHGADEEMEDDLYHSDAVAMYHNSQDFLARSSQVNATSEKLADWLQSHPNVQTVYYPKFTQPDLYNTLRHEDHKQHADAPHPVHTSGYGGLMAILLEPHTCQRTFYDTLAIYKGPSLGTNFSLACPYTLLAHYHELEFARAYKVSPNLIRIAVGLESYDDLKDRFELALNKSRLHPPLPPPVAAAAAPSDIQQRAYSAWATSRTFNSQARSKYQSSTTQRHYPAAPLLGTAMAQSLPSGTAKRLHSTSSALLRRSAFVPKAIPSFYAAAGAVLAANGAMTMMLGAASKE